MRSLYSRAPTTPQNLQYCHHYSLPPICRTILLNSPRLIFLRLSNIRTTTTTTLSSSSSIQPVIASSMASSTDTTTTTTTTTKPYAVLFVCLGNICRSPAAEGVFTDLVNKRRLVSKFKIDSAGTIGYHEGNPADPRMRAASKRRGIEITSISRPIRPSDFRDFDLILAMDMQNKDDILGALERWRFKETLPADAHKKVRLMCSYCKKHDETEVPDPYYGGPQGFEKHMEQITVRPSQFVTCIQEIHSTSKGRCSRAREDDK